MKYLMYYSDGFIKKFPLDKNPVTIGWSNKNDLTIKEDLISNQHLKIDVMEDSIIIEDLNSTNGTYVNSSKIKREIIKIGESFTIGGKEFFLKKGALEEFKAAKELIPIFNKIGKEIETTAKQRKTKYLKNVYMEVLKHILKVGLKKENSNDLIFELSNHLSNLTDLGSLFIVSKRSKKTNILLSIKKNRKDFENLNKIIKKHNEIFSKNLIYYEIPGEKEFFYSYFIQMKKNDAALIYIPKDKNKRENVKIEEFLSILSKEISLLLKIIPENIAFDGSNDTYISKNHNIIGTNKEIRELIKQAERIAKSDIFVLIQGESGVGKELFARLIHERSKRGKNKLVAINCAAIPEQLLEAELFGYEKGAFTVGYAQKKGKLELASGGTLLLDEIGDMPFNLQSRLLRALQENEFYRLGGTKPIKVDLRIISVSNKSLKNLVDNGKFREDLYYRLVHHVMVIPPLRERREDISLFINHFTWKVLNKTNKKIKGYSIKVLKTLQNCSWPGNVRQLKNEVIRLVNLTDEHELINFDLISEDIKSCSSNNRGVTNKSEKRESEIEKIIRVLEKNNWNKTHAAKELGMTYRGLHKKMKRLGISKDKESTR